MKKPKIQITRLLVVVTICCALVVGNFILSNTVAEAATKKASISTTEMTIPIGSLNNKTYWNTNSWELTNAQKLSVNNIIKGAKYQFTSSNIKVAKISKNGGFLTGLKAGNTIITCTQTYKNKKTTVGKCKVTVKNAGITVNTYENEYPVGKGEFNLMDYYASDEPLFNITYRNPNATYSLTSNSENFSIKGIKNDASKVKAVTDNKEYQSILKDYIGSRYFYGYEFTAKKSGTYTVTVKETYNKKTKTLGNFKVIIKDTSISESNIDLLLGNEINTLSLINYTKENTNYYFEIKDYDEINQDNNVLKLSKKGSEVYLYGNKTGTAEVTVREGSEQGTLIGTVIITVAEAPCESITLDAEEYTVYVDEEYFRIYYDLEPWDTTDKVTIESDNTDVLKVEYDEENESWVYRPLKVGEAKVTIKCGNQSVVCKVIVEEW